MMQIYNKYWKKKSFERNIFDNFTQTITLVTLRVQSYTIILVLW